MKLLYPRLHGRDLCWLLATMACGAAVAGCYGALHDQASFSISPEYFTRMKFEQFGLVELGERSPRLAVAATGFFATWWVGAIGGWFIGRACRAGRDWREPLRAFGVCLALAMLAAVLGGALGAWRAHGDLAAWAPWKDGLGIEDLRSFVVVAVVHEAGYAGAISGLLIAIVWLRRRARAS